MSDAGRTEAISLARPRTDQEIEDRFVDFMVRNASNEMHVESYAGLFYRRMTTRFWKDSYVLTLI